MQAHFLARKSMSTQFKMCTTLWGFHKPGFETCNFDYTIHRPEEQGRLRKLQGFVQFRVPTSDFKIRCPVSSRRTLVIMVETLATKYRKTGSPVKFTLWQQDTSFNSQQTLFSMKTKWKNELVLRRAGNISGGHGTRGDVSRITTLPQTWRRVLIQSRLSFFCTCIGLW